MRGPFLILVLTLSAAFWPGADAAPSDARLKAHIESLSKAFPNSSANKQEPHLSPARLVPQKPGQPYDFRFPPVWFTELGAGPVKSGYLMWADSERAELLEFAVERAVPTPESGAVVWGVPALQQFPVDGGTGRKVASGCVPTAGGSLIGFWVANGYPQWAGSTGGNSQNSLEQYTRRLRDRLRMQEIADTAGYTDDGMPLSGAWPEELAQALEKDAIEFGIPLRAKHQRFSTEALKEEVSQKHPVLLSCAVRLPHKPNLSWGHEIIGVGWVQIGGLTFVGVKDNFFPSSDKDLIRWIREDFFTSIITVR